MAWLTATTLEGKNANLQSTQIAVILDRVKGSPGEGSLITLASGGTLEVKESPAELLRQLDTLDHPENPPASPGNVW